MRILATAENVEHPRLRLGYSANLRHGVVTSRDVPESIKDNLRSDFEFGMAKFYRV